MGKTFGLTLAACASALGVASTAHAESLRCGNRLVGVGDTALELKARCGPPDHREVRPLLRAEGYETPRPAYIPRGGGVAVVGAPTLRQVRYVRESVETWLYTGGKERLARAVTVRRGHVTDIETLGHLDGLEDPGCGRALEGPGARVGVVYVTCGPPDDRAVWEEEASLEVAGVLRRELVVRERWTYDPGPGRLLRVLEFANGRLLRVETGGRAP